MAAHFDPLADPAESWDLDAATLDDAPDMWERVDHLYDAYCDFALDLL